MSEQPIQQQLTDLELALQSHLHLAKQSATQGDYESAVAEQSAGVQLARQVTELNPERGSWMQLSVLLYNLGGFYAKLTRFEEAITCFEEVVVIDEQIEHPDLENDKQALEAAKVALQRQQNGEAPKNVETKVDAQSLLSAELSPEHRAMGGQILGQMSQDATNAPPEKRQQIVELMQDILSASAEGQADYIEQIHFQSVQQTIITQLQQTFTQSYDAERQLQIAENIAHFIVQIEPDRTLGEQRHPLIQLLQCAYMKLRGQTVALPVPEIYQPYWDVWTLPS